MQTLKEILDEFGPFGVSDFEIIKRYFLVNHFESQAVKMLTEISQATIERERAYNQTLKDCFLYSYAFLYNKKLTNKQQIKLLSLYISFVNNGELNEYRLKEAKEIFDILDKDNFQSCPQFFLAYLQANGIGTQFPDASLHKLDIIESKGGER